MFWRSLTSYFARKEEGRKGGREEGKDFYNSMLFDFYKKHVFAFLKTLKSV